MSDVGPVIAKMRRDWSAALEASVVEVPSGNMHRARIAALIAELPIGGELRIKRVSERRIRFLRR